jgi:hypothetical protein
MPVYEPDMRRRLAIVALATLLAAACTGPLELSEIQLGRSINADNSVGAPTTFFRPNDTVYVSIHTTARGRGTVGVRWKYRDQVIDEPSKQVSTDGTEAIEFHLQNSGGFPIGDYSVDVFIDGKQVGTKAFKVDAR